MPTQLVPIAFTPVEARRRIAHGYLASEYSGDTPATGPTTQAMLDDFARPGHLSYVYLGAGLTESTAARDIVIAYEIPTDENGQTSMVLLGERGIESLDRRQTAALLRAVAASTRPVHFTIPPRER
jgi:hypothetical protein